MDLINRNNAITSICQWLTTLERKNEYIITVAEMKQEIADILCEEQKVDAVPMSVIEEIKAEIVNISRIHRLLTEDGQDCIQILDVFEIINRKVKEYTDAT